MQKQLQEQIDRLKAAGATYVDARWYPVEEANYLMMWNGNLKNAAASRESGVGIRVLHKGAWGFSASSDLSSLSGLFDKAFDNARVAAERVTFPVRLAEKDAIQAEFTSPCQINPFDVPLAEIVDLAPVAAGGQRLPGERVAVPVRRPAGLGWRVPEVKEIPIKEIICLLPGSCAFPIPPGEIGLERGAVRWI